MGLEGIVSKRLGSRYRSGRSPDWLKFKNPAGAGGETRGGRGLGSLIITRGLAASLQGRVTETLRVALTSFRKLDNLLGDRFTGRVDEPIGALEGHKGHFESDAHETDGLRVEPKAAQVCPDRHDSAQATNED